MSIRDSTILICFLGVVPLAGLTVAALLLFRQADRKLTAWLSVSYAVVLAALGGLLAVGDWNHSGDDLWNAHLLAPLVLAPLVGVFALLARRASRTPMRDAATNWYSGLGAAAALVSLLAYGLVVVGGSGE